MIWQMKESVLALEYIRQGKMPDPTKTYDLNGAVGFVAECQEMCPEFEREEREFTNFLEVFEKIFKRVFSLILDSRNGSSGSRKGRLLLWHHQN